MVYTSSIGLRDREYNKFLTTDRSPGSLSVIAVRQPMQVYTFTPTELCATNVSTDPALGNSGGNFKSYSSIPLNGELKCIEWCSGNNTNGSLFIFESGGAHLQIWGTITRTLASSFAVMPRAYTVNTIDGATGSDYVHIPLSNYIEVIGSDIGKGKSGLALNIVYQ